MKHLLLTLLALVARLFTRPPGPSQVRRILVLKPDHLGDLLLAAPALRALRGSLPAAQIAALVGPWSRRMWQGCPDLDALIELPFPGFDRGGQGGRGTEGVGAARRAPTVVLPYLVLLKYAWLLRAHRYDAALLLRDDHWWGAALIALAGIPRRIGHAHPLCAPFLTDALPYNPREHVTRQALAVVGRLAEGLGGGGTRGQGDKGTRGQGDKGTRGQGDRGTRGQGDKGMGQGALYAPLVPPSASAASGPIPPSASAASGPAPLSASAASAPWLPAAADHSWAEAWLAAHLAPGERLVVIHPGTGGPAKHWPPEGWAAVGAALSARPGLRLLLTGGPGEGALVEQIAARISPAPLALAGKTGVGQLAALLGRAALVLGVDSGPLHIAVSQGAPSVHLFGPSDQLRFGPWGDPARHIVLRADIPCSPCGVFSACPRRTAGPECMALITPQDMLAAIDRLL